MLIKWVSCQVTDREAFSRGQEGWGALADVPGFLGQCGGWSGRVAHVFAWWRSPDDHEAFLAGPHDRLAAAQIGSYGDIDVRLFESELTIGVGNVVGLVPGLVLEPSWTVLR